MYKLPQTSVSNTFIYKVNKEIHNNIVLNSNVVYVGGNIILDFLYLSKHGLHLNYQAKLITGFYF